MKPRVRHLIGMAVVVVGMLSVLYVVAQNTDSYEAAERFVRQDASVERITGAVHRVKFKFWKGFDFASTSISGEADFTFEVVGEKDTLIIQVHLQETSGEWRVVAANGRHNDSANAFDLMPKR